MRMQNIVNLPAELTYLNWTFLKKNLLLKLMGTFLGGRICPCVLTRRSHMDARKYMASKRLHSFFLHASANITKEGKENVLLSLRPLSFEALEEFV